MNFTKLVDAETLVAEAIVRGDTDLDRHALVERITEIAPEFAVESAAQPPPHFRQYQERCQAWDDAVPTWASGVRKTAI